MYSVQQIGKLRITVKPQGEIRAPLKSIAKLLLISVGLELQPW